MLPQWNWDAVNFWPQLAFAFTGLELVSAMSDEVRDPRKTLPRAIFGSGVLIALIYIAGTVAVLVLLNDSAVDPKSGVFQAITAASAILKIGALGVIAALLVTVGNAGGVGSTVTGIARVPFIGWRGPISAGRFRQDPSALADAVRIDSGAGDYLRRNSSAEPD